MRDSAIIQLAAMQVEKPKYLSYEEAKASNRVMVSTDRGWNYWVARAKKAMPDLKNPSV